METLETLEEIETNDKHEKEALLFESPGESEADVGEDRAELAYEYMLLNASSAAVFEKPSLTVNGEPRAIFEHPRRASPWPENPPGHIVAGELQEVYLQVREECSIQGHGQSTHCD